jgi:hypothetical protein
MFIRILRAGHFSSVMGRVGEEKVGSVRELAAGEVVAVLAMGVEIEDGTLFRLEGKGWVCLPDGSYEFTPGVEAFILAWEKAETALEAANVVGLTVPEARRYAKILRGRGVRVRHLPVGL